MSEQFPMFRLATLLMRQLSSPVASRIKRYALSHPKFGGWACRGCARTYLSLEWRVRRLALRLGGTSMPSLAKPPPVSDERALNLGSDLFGELIIFLIGASIVIFEVNRQAINKEAKKMEHRSQWAAVTLSLEELSRELELQQADLDRMFEVLREAQNSHM